jgi:hypothetical protein
MLGTARADFNRVLVFYYGQNLRGAMICSSIRIQFEKLQGFMGNPELKWWVYPEQYWFCCH